MKTDEDKATFKILECVSKEHPELELSGWFARGTGIGSINVHAVVRALDQVLRSTARGMAMNSIEAVSERLAELIGEIRELNLTAEDENGHRWSNSDLIDQTCMLALTELQALRSPIQGEVKALEWIDSKALMGRKLIARDMFGNEFARFDYDANDMAETDLIEPFKKQTQTAYERHVLSCLAAPESIAEAVAWDDDSIQRLQKAIMDDDEEVRERAASEVLGLYESAVEPYAAALRMVREGIGDLFGPVASIESDNAVLLRGPKPHHEAEAQIAALQRATTPPSPKPEAVSEGERLRIAKAFHDGPLGADDHDFNPDNKQGQWCLEVVDFILSQALSHPKPTEHVWVVDAAQSLLASLNPNALTPEQFFAWCDLEHALSGVSAAQQAGEQP